MNFCCLSHPVHGSLLGQPCKLIQTLLTIQIPKTLFLEVNSYLPKQKISYNIAGDKVSKTARNDFEVAGLLIRRIIVP
jgi:hypothetical protein